MIQLYTANSPKHFYAIFFNALCCRTAKKQCNFRFTVIFIMPRRGVKNHLSFTSKKELQSKNPWPTLLGLLSEQCKKKQTKKCNFGKDKNQHFCREGFFQVVRGHYSRRDNFFKTYHFACDQYIFASALFLNFKTLSSARNAHTHTTRHPWFCFKKKVC